MTCFRKIKVKNIFMILQAKNIYMITFYYFYNESAKAIFSTSP